MCALERRCPGIKMLALKRVCDGSAVTGCVKRYRDHNAALVLDAKTGSLKVYLNARCLPTLCGRLRVFLPPWIWADSISFEEHLKSHQTKKQNSQVVAPAGFSDIIDTTHRLLLCHGTFYWFAIQYWYKGFHYLYLRLEGSLFCSEGDRVLFQRLVCIFSPCHDFSALTGFSFRC